MKRTLQAVFLAILAAEVLVLGQGADAKKVLSDLRTALGGDQKLAAINTLAIEGQVTKPNPDGTSNASEFEMAFELPDKFMKKEVFADIGGMKLNRRTGFNGGEVIEDIDAPPAMGGGMHIMRMSPGGPMPGGKATPEQIASQRQQLLQSSHREYARLTLGMFGASSPVYPVEFTYAGQAESPDGKADILDVKGPDGFTAKLFVDGRTRLPLMLSWMDKEPLRVRMESGGQRSGSPQDAAELQQQMAERVKTAEANRRTVEYRIFYGNYKPYGGVQIPTRIQRMVDGLPTEELSLEKIKINGKIDASKFDVVK